MTGFAPTLPCSASLSGPVHRSASTDPLVRHPRVIATPHVAWYTEMMFRRSAEVFAASLRRYESGPLPLWTVNEPAFAADIYSLYVAK